MASFLLSCSDGQTALILYRQNGAEKAISSFAIHDLLLPAGAKGGKTPARGP